MRLPDPRLNCAAERGKGVLYRTLAQLTTLDYSGILNKEVYKRKFMKLITCVRE